MLLGGARDPRRLTTKRRLWPPVGGLSMHWRIRAVAFSTGVVLLLSAVQPPRLAAATAISCSEIPITNRHQGQVVFSTSQKHGIKATVENQALQQCTNPGFPIELSGSFIWVNIVPSDGTNWDIIQLGVGVCRGGIECVGTMHYQAARGRSDDTPGCAGFTNEAPIGHRFSGYVPDTHVLELVHTGNLWSHRIDGIIKEGLAESWVCWTPRKAIWFAETLDYGDAMGGTPTNEFSIYNARYTNTEGGAWILPTFPLGPTCNYVDGPAPWNCRVLSQTQINVWTNNR